MNSILVSSDSKIKNNFGRISKDVETLLQSHISLISMISNKICHQTIHLVRGSTKYLMLCNNLLFFHLSKWKIIEMLMTLTERKSKVFCNTVLYTHGDKVGSTPNWPRMLRVWLYPSFEKLSHSILALAINVKKSILKHSHTQINQRLGQ